MLDEKHERYWDGLDIEAEWQQFLDSEHEEYKKSTNTYYYRTRSINNMSEELADTFLRDEADSDIAEEKEYIKSISIQKLMLILETLTKKQQLAIKLYIMCGYKQKTVAEIMRCSKSSTSELISRALTKIKSKTK